MSGGEKKQVLELSRANGRVRPRRRVARGKLVGPPQKKTMTKEEHRICAAREHPSSHAHFVAKSLGVKAKKSSKAYVCNASNHLPATLSSLFSSVRPKTPVRDITLRKDKFRVFSQSFKKVRTNAML